MQISVLVEPVANNGFRARAGEPFGLCCEGTTREEAIANLRALCAAKLRNGAELLAVEVGSSPNPLLQFAGMFKDDPYFPDWQKAIEEYRREMNEDPNYL
jgi:hypothetical protein